jgi:hypothetical protein
MMKYLKSPWVIALVVCAGVFYAYNKNVAGIRKYLGGAA